MPRAAWVSIRTFSYATSIYASLSTIPFRNHAIRSTRRRSGGPRMHLQLAPRSPE